MYKNLGVIFKFSGRFDCVFIDVLFYEYVVFLASITFCLSV